MIPAIVYGFVVLAIALALGYALGRDRVFGTAGHTSTEFKLTAGVLAAACMHWTLGAVRGSDAGLEASWLAVAVVVAAYTVSRALVKRKK